MVPGAPVDPNGRINDGRRSGKDLPEMTPLLNERNRMDGARLLTSIEDCAAALVVFDPQYRGILDKMAYGNEGSRQKGRAALPQMTDAKITVMMAEIERVLQPSGHLVLWMDKFTLVSGRWHRWMPDPSPLRAVDCLIWDKERIAMGKRMRYRWEAAVIVQLAPIKVKPMWPDRRMPDVLREKSDRQRHAHAKPVELMKMLIRQMTSRGDLVVDPCAGGYGTLEACQATGRNFLGCDLVT